MSEPRQCVYCQRFDVAPDVLPFLTESGPVWAHRKCEQQIRAARKPIPEVDLPRLMESGR